LILKIKTQKPLRYNSFRNWGF